MSDNESPSVFAPFQPAGTVPESTETPEKGKRKRKARAEVPVEPSKPETTQPRQRRKRASSDKPALKFDLQTILSAASKLNADDYPLFEKLVNILDEAGKPGRERLLAAIRKVFGEHG